MKILSTGSGSIGPELFPFGSTAFNWSSPCDRSPPQAEVPVYNYSVPGFYGFRGEFPGQQQFDRSDFSGYASGLQCLHVAVKTGKFKSPGQCREPLICYIYHCFWLDRIFALL